MTDNILREGEAAAVLPAQPDAGIYFIGTIHTPWHRREDCPSAAAWKDRSAPSWWMNAGARRSTGIAVHPRIQVLYWMHHARRDLVLQTPYSTGRTTGTFALRSPVRPNPIATSVVALIAVEGNTLHVRGLDCLSGTPLLDLKPERGASEQWA